MRAGRVVCAVVLIAGLARGEKALTSATLREYVLEHYQQSPPDYTCSRATHLESHNPIPPPPGGLSGWYTDTAEEELTVHGLREQHQTVNIDPDATAVGHLRNPITSGEFGVILKNLVGLKSKSKVRWVRFDNLRGRRVSVFTFDVPRSEGARVYDSDNRPVVVAYHGFLYADGETHSVMRVETRLPEFPAESNVKSMLVTLDYQVTKLGNHEFLLPQGFEIHWARNPKDSLPKTPAGLFPRFSTQPDFAFAEYRNYRPLTARSRRSDAESHAEITFGDATRDQK